MNTQTKLFTGAVALALAASTVLTASSASARPYNDRYYDDRVVWEERDRDDRYYGRDYRFKNRGDYRRFHRRLNRRNIYISPPYGRARGYYGNRLVRLPDGCRRVVYRDRVYYTRDNNVYYAYDNDRRDYFVVNLPGIRIGF
ncbi:hypothetical protein [Altericista sp. CCNU0014]|uniref:hypothetical protein n=1 Tax=Altericista sp. CCNU0014 TaxID=3082949 RepID=UPI00384F62E0